MTEVPKYPSCFHGVDSTSLGALWPKSHEVQHLQTPWVGDFTAYAPDIVIDGTSHRLLRPPTSSSSQHSQKRPNQSGSFAVLDKVQASFRATTALLFIEMSFSLWVQGSDIGLAVNQVLTNPTTP
ncbi:hypothetical protein I304_04167 [Cryptococcus deuterogattii CBS 10090]|nr:hypothetical protein I304_04167 [Cryptococcus deuterogattii CBS 10090]